jgi:hypothetical protein
LALKTVANLAPPTTDSIAVSVAQVDKRASEGRSVNMRRYLNSFTINDFSRLIHIQLLGCLNRGNDIVDADTPTGKVYHVLFIKSLHNVERHDLRDTSPHFICSFSDCLHSYLTSLVASHFTSFA